MEWSITSGTTRAVLTRRGAFLREFSVDGRPFLTTFDPGETPFMMDGGQLLPWPGRVADGRWPHATGTQQLPITEPDRHNAIHGLAHQLDWDLLHHERDHVVLGCTVSVQPGWPGELAARLSARVATDRLDVTVQLQNTSDEVLPVGYGCHPYLTLGGVPRAEWTLSAPFTQVLRVDERLLPTGLVDVDSPASPVPDLRTPRVMGDLVLDHAFTGAPAPWEVRVEHDGVALVLHSADMGWAQLFTHDDDRLAVEPMSMGADAFNGGPGSAGARTLHPGQTASWSWGLRVEK